MSSFYDDDWMKLCKNYPLVSKKLEELRCETVNYEEFLEEITKIRIDLQKLAKAVMDLLEVFVEKLMKER